MKPRILLPMIAVSGLLALSAASLYALDVPLLADAYTSNYSTNGNTNYGAAVTMVVNGASGYNRRVWLKFDLDSALPVGTTWDQVAHATLRVFVTNTAGTGGLVSIYAAASAWDEATLKHNGAPNPVGQPYTGSAYATPTWSNTDDYYTVDVTELVRDWLDTNPSEHRDNHGLIIYGASGTNLTLDSKEATTTSHPASLHIVLAGPQGVQGAQGPTGKSVLSGSGTPGAGTGADGDFYIDTATNRIYGPKVGGNWPGTSTPLVGPQGIQGPQGSQGPQGGVGPQGPATVRINAQGNLGMGSFTAGTPP